MPIEESKYIKYRQDVAATKDVGRPSGALSQRTHGKKGKASFGSVLDHLKEEEENKKGTDSNSSTRLARGADSNPSSATNATETPESHVKQAKEKLLKAEALTVAKTQNDEISKVDVNPIKADD